jgi:hypothetical protein
MKSLQNRNIYSIIFILIVFCCCKNADREFVRLPLIKEDKLYIGMTKKQVENHFGESLENGYYYENGLSLFIGYCNKKIDKFNVELMIYYYFNDNNKLEVLCVYYYSDKQLNEILIEEFCKEIKGAEYLNKDNYFKYFNRDNNIFAEIYSLNEFHNCKTYTKAVFANVVSYNKLFGDVR